jgi:hypothetical protein
LEARWATHPAASTSAMAAIHFSERRLIFIARHE